MSPAFTYDQVRADLSGPVREWVERARCRGMDPEVFFVHRGEHDRLRHAKSICAQCPVAQECLDYSIDAGEKEGVWGGVSERERRRLRRKKKVAA